MKGTGLYRTTWRSNLHIAEMMLSDDGQTFEKPLCGTSMRAPSGRPDQQNGLRPLRTCARTLEPHLRFSGCTRCWTKAMKRMERS